MEIINTIFVELDIPESLKKGILTPVLKKGNHKHKPGNYRGIVVTSCFTKILEAILKERLDQIFNQHQVSGSEDSLKKARPLTLPFLFYRNFHSL